MLVLSSVPFPAPAAASGALEVDAGASQVAWDGAPLALSALVRGGAEPYAYAWIGPDGAARFADATAASTAFDTTGLAGAFAVTLTVTDALGAMASASVTHHAASAPLLLDVSQAVAFGAPNEILFTGPPDERRHAFTVPAGFTTVVATLDWTNASHDFDVALYRNGTRVTGNQGATSAKPESASAAATEGAWQARVWPFLSGPDTYALRVRAVPTPPLPAVTPFAANYMYGTDDAHELRAVPSGGAAPYAVAWDLDLDGWFETSGTDVTAALPEGAHLVPFRARDAAGYVVENRVLVRVAESEHVQRLTCGGPPTTPHWSMEHSASGNTCYMHLGHLTWYLGDDSFHFRGLTGYGFNVEMQYAPPMEFADGDPTVAPVVVEASLDGRTWTTLGHGEYPLVVKDGDVFPDRQRVTFDLAGNGAEYRFVRVHHPKSATQGLSGFVDAANLDVRADRADPRDAYTFAETRRELDCATDVMEDFFAEHPCWFGGIDRYDAPSFFHTYFLDGPSTLARVEGEFTLGPWRSDDWFTGKPVAQWPVWATQTTARVQTSVDGIVWTTQATIPAKFGESTAFTVDLADVEANFVRFLPEEHAAYADANDCPPCHHPRGFFLDSRVAVEGLLPVES